MKRNVPKRAAKRRRQILGQYVLSRCLWPCQQKILAAQQGRCSLFPYFPPIVLAFGRRNPFLIPGIRRIVSPKSLNSPDNITVYMLFF